MIRSRLALILALASLGAATGCRSGNYYEVGQPSAVLLEVRNDNFADMDLYAVGDGLATRIGTVTGNSTQRFALNESLTRASDLRIVATPIGGNGRASTGPIMVNGGQTIFFNINPVLRMSSVSIR